MAGLKKTILSGMRPTGRLHLGNWAGALQGWVGLQDEFHCFFMIADWHALTTGYEDTSRLRENIRELLLDWLAAGLDPERSVFFVQSTVKEQAELQLLLSMITPLSWLERVPTYKEQLRELTGREIATHGFLGYPVLQAADILAYRADVVPVGEDQLPHLELSREIARRFNHLYATVFPEPQGRLTEVPYLPGLDGRKMSKSYGNIIELAVETERLPELVGTMLTDPQRARRKDPGRPEVCPVYSYHAAWSDGAEEMAVACQQAAIGCVECKRLLASRLSELLGPISSRRRELAARPRDLDEILDEGGIRARSAAAETMEKVRSAMRLWPG